MPSRKSGSTPIAPLRPIDPSKVAVLIGPLVPDRYTMLVEEPKIRFAADKPKQLERDGLEMYAFGREKRETIGKIKSGLGPEIGNRADPGAIFFGFAFFEN